MVGYGQPPKEHQWKPGQSGNPAGRPSLGASVREWLNQLQDKTPAEWVRVAKDKKSPGSKVMAAKRLLAAIEDGRDFDRVLDRTEGRPTETQNLNVQGELHIKRIIAPK